MLSATEFQLQYRSVKEKVGFFDLSDRGKIEVRGRDATTFLHNLLSHDIQGLSIPGISYAAMLDPKGKVLADLYVWAQPNRYLVETEPFLFTRVSERLHSFLVSEEVLFQDRTQDYYLLALEGAQSESLIKRLAPLDRGILVGNRSLIGLKGYSLMIPHDLYQNFFQKLLKEGEAFGLTLIELDVQECLRIESGVPRYGLDFNEGNLLPEVRLFRAVSYTKGCYIGQEVIARMKNLGHLNRQLVGLKISGEKVPLPKTKLYDQNREVGWITSACFSPQWASPLALGFIQRPYVKEAKRLELEQDPSRVPAEIVSLPGLPLEDPK